MISFFRRYSLFFLLLVSTIHATHGNDAKRIVQELGLAEVSATLDSTKTQRCLATRPIPATNDVGPNAALLSCLGLYGSAEQIGTTWRYHPIFSQLHDPGVPSWSEQDALIIQDFQNRLSKALEANLSTGYNLLPHAIWPEFAPERTVIYGHNNWKHARQLVALLQTEGLSPRLVPVSKKSVFVFRDDWGTPSKPLRKLANGQRLVGGFEFDLFLEFANTEEVVRFGELITQYAKKDTANETGLLHGAWWQPFYRTLVPVDGAHKLTVLLVSYKGYRANLMSLPNEATEKLKQLRALDPDWSVEPIDIWVNPGFYRFQLGDYR